MNYTVTIEELERLSKELVDIFNNCYDKNTCKWKSRVNGCNDDEFKASVTLFLFDCGTLYGNGNKTRGKKNDNYSRIGTIIKTILPILNCFFPEASRMQLRSSNLMYFINHFVTDFYPPHLI